MVVLPPQTTGWSKTPLSNTKTAWQEKSMRTFGFATDIYRSLGSEVMQLPVEEIPPKFKSNEINFYEFALPSNDQNYGLDKLGAQYYYVTGYMEPGTVIYLLFNLDYWLQLSLDDQRLLQVESRAALEQYLLQLEVLQVSTIKKFSQEGIKILQTPELAVDAVRSEWNKFVEKTRIQDKLFDETIKDIENYAETKEAWDKMTGTWEQLL